MGGVMSAPIKLAQNLGVVSTPKPVSAPAPMATTTSPTTAEVSQASATDAQGLKRRRRGRSSTILTGAAGIEQGATLGTPTLLG